MSETSAKNFNALDLKSAAEIHLTRQGEVIAVLMSPARHQTLVSAVPRPAEDPLAIVNAVITIVEEALGIDLQELGWLPCDLPQLVKSLVSYDEGALRHQVKALEDQVDGMTDLLDDIARAVGAAPWVDREDDVDDEAYQSPALFHAQLPRQVAARLVVPADVASMQLASLKLEVTGMREHMEGLKRERAAALDRATRDREQLADFRRLCAQDRNVLQILGDMLDLPQPFSGQDILDAVSELLSDLANDEGGEA